MDPTKRVNATTASHARAITVAAGMRHEDERDEEQRRHLRIDQRRSQVVDVDGQHRQRHCPANRGDAISRVPVDEEKDCGHLARDE